MTTPKTATPTGLDGVLGYQLARAAVAVDAVFEREVGQPHALRPVEYAMLALIAAQPGTTPVRLARELAVTKPQVTLRVDRLVAAGLVQRRPHAADGRAQELHPTAEGRALADRATARLHAAERDALAMLSPGERAILLELLQKVARGAAAR